MGAAGRAHSPIPSPTFQVTTQKASGFVYIFQLYYTVFVLSRAEGISYFSERLWRYGYECFALLLFLDNCLIVKKALLFTVFG